MRHSLGLKVSTSVGQGPTFMTPLQTPHWTNHWTALLTSPPPPPGAPPRPAKLKREIQSILGWDITDIISFPKDLWICGVSPTCMKSLAEERSCCPGCGKVVYFAEKVSSLGRNWHRPCLRCERCKKTLTPGGHAEHDGKPFCHVPCYGYLFGPKGVNIGDVGCYVYERDKEEAAVTDH
ncbi:uncharacterized protein [Paramormyrops kingsleyae]|uniref:uncharacterized protein isoform X3 n=1 Tax=Paramormyrops kingsleyae TaxID=1676925 RepID=UPI000CD5E11E|nr:cysteine and glycine-rich protein 3-like isoform X3 [Paramormyrops kingsleyae]